jgi:hypothetical protein
MPGAKVVPVRFRHPTLERLDELSLRFGMCRSEVIRLAVDRLARSTYDAVIAAPAAPGTRPVSALTQAALKLRDQMEKDAPGVNVEVIP